MIGTLELTASADLRLLITEHTRALERLAAAIEAQTKGRPAAITEAVASIPVQTTPSVAEPEQKPAPAPEPATPSAGDFLTAERRALLEKEYPAGVHINGILERFNRLDGPKVQDAQRLSLLANGLKLRRPKPFDGAGAPMTLAEVEAAERTVPVAHYTAPLPRPAPPPATPKPPPGRALSKDEVLARIGAMKLPGAHEPIEADFEQVRTFAESRALQFRDWDDLPAINRWRTDPRRNLAPFKRKLPGRSIHRAGASA